VLRANALGDFVFAIPALRALRVQFPAARLTLLGRAWHADLLDGRDDLVDEVVVLPDVPGLTAPDGAVLDASWDAWVEQQRARRYDLGVQLHGGGRYSNPVVAALRAGLSIGLHTPDAVALDRSVPYVDYQNEVVRLLEVVGLVGATGQPYPGLRPRLLDRTAAAAHLPEVAGRRYAVLHPGATDPRRRWSAHRFAAVADVLADEGLLPVVTGTAEEASLTRTVMTQARAEVVDATGRLPLAGLVGLLADAEVVVSNDTGPLHLADALGCPTVGIFWCGNLINGGPLRRDRHRPLLSWTVHCPRCGADCTRDLYPARTGGSACRHSVSFVDDVPVVEVTAAASSLLAQHGRRSTAERVPARLG
jgi:ADP-heptose:LPS heptosyltransferase